MRATILLWSTLLACGCTKDGSLVVLVVGANGTLSDVAALGIDATAGGRTLDTSVSLTNRSIPPEQRIGIQLSAAQTGTIDVTVEAHDTSGAIVATASGSTTIVVGGQVELPITFSTAGIEDAGVDAGADLAGDDGAVTPPADLLVVDLASKPITFTATNLTNGVSVELHGLWGGDASHVWVSGHDSANTFFSTGDDSWTQYSSNPFYDVNGLWGTDTTHGWMVDANGTVRILNTTGTAWGTQADLNGNLTAVWGTSATNVFVISNNTSTGQLFHNTTATNTSTNWSSRSADSFGYNAIHGAAADDIYIVGDGGNIIRTDTVNFTYHNFGTHNLNGVFAVDGTHIYVVGDAGGIGFSVGNGDFTQQLVPSLQANTNFHAVWASGPNDIWVVGDNGTILHSVGDGSWTKVASDVTSALFAVWGTGPRNVYACSATGDVTHGH